MLTLQGTRITVKNVESPVEKNTTTQEFSVSSDDLTKKVKELFHEGNVTRIIVKDENGSDCPRL